MLQGVPELRLIHQAIHNTHIIPFCLECPKHSIPNNQHCPIVFVQTVSIRPMVNLQFELDILSSSNLALVVR